MEVGWEVDVSWTAGKGNGWGVGDWLPLLDALCNVHQIVKEPLELVFLDVRVEMCSPTRD